MTLDYFLKKSFKYNEKDKFRLKLNNKAYK